MTLQNSHKEQEVQRIMLDTDRAADYLGVKPGLLAKWRHRKMGPKHTALVGAIRYDRADLDRFIDENAGGKAKRGRR